MRWRLGLLVWQMTTARLTRQSGGDIRQGCWDLAAVSRFEIQHLCPRPCRYSTYEYSTGHAPASLSGRTSVTHPSSHRRVLGLGLQDVAHHSCQLFAGASLCAAGLEKRQRGGEKPATRIEALAMGRLLLQYRTGQAARTHACGGSHRQSISTVLCRLPLPVSPASHSPCVPGWCLGLSRKGSVPRMATCWAARAVSHSHLDGDRD